MDGFEKISTRDAPVYVKERAGHIAIVQCFGSSWGFTLWAQNRCVGGGKDWEWTLDDACAQADAALSVLVV